MRALSLVLLGVLFASGVRLFAAEAAAMPPYPRVNMAPWYVADPNWPQRPADLKWGDMSGVAVDGQDRVWLYTRAQPPVQVFSADGKFIRSWGSDTIDRAHFLRFDHEGRVWVTDVGKHVVMQFTPEGKLLRTLGTPGQPGEDATHLNKPTDVAVTPAGEIYVSDGYGNNRVVQFDRDGKFVRSWGRLGVKPGEFSLPHSLALDSQGRIYVADRNNQRVQVFDAQGKFLAEWRNLIVPWGLWMMKNDELWVSGSSPMPWRDEDRVLSCPPKDQILMRFDTTGRALQLWTLPLCPGDQFQPGGVDWLHGVTVDSHGNLYVGDIKGQRAQKLVRQE